MDRDEAREQILKILEEYGFDSNDEDEKEFFLTLFESLVVSDWKCCDCGYEKKEEFALPEKCPKCGSDFIMISLDPESTGRYDAKLEELGNKLIEKAGFKIMDILGSLSPPMTEEDDPDLPDQGP